MNHHTYPLEVNARALNCFEKMLARFVTGNTAADAATMEKMSTLVRKHEGSPELELQLRSCEYGALVDATQGVTNKRDENGNGGGEEDIFEAGAGMGGSESNVSATVIGATKEALARIPVVDVKLMRRKREERI